MFHTLVYPPFFECPSLDRGTQERTGRPTEEVLGATNPRAQHPPASPHKPASSHRKHHKALEETAPQHHHKAHHHKHSTHRHHPQHDTPAQKGQTKAKPEQPRALDRSRSSSSSSEESALNRHSVPRRGAGAGASQLSSASLAELERLVEAQHRQVSVHDTLNMVRHHCVFTYGAET